MSGKRLCSYRALIIRCPLYVPEQLATGRTIVRFETIEVNLNIGEIFDNLVK